MGVGVARVLGAIPRAVAVTVVAVPKQRPPLETDYGRILFVRRTLDTLDLERADTELTQGWITTPEQTVLDLAARPLSAACHRTPSPKPFALCGHAPTPNCLRSWAGGSARRPRCGVPAISSTPKEADRACFPGTNWPA